MEIEEFFKNSSDEQIQEFIKTVDMDEFCKIIDEFPFFVKARIFENVTDRVQIHIEEKINQSKTNPLTPHEKEELKKHFNDKIENLTNRVVLRVKVQKHILLFIIITPLIFLFGFGMTFSKTQTGESFVPFVIGGVIFILFGLLATRELFTQITQTKEYIFDINYERILIKSSVNGVESESYVIERSNLASFEPSYWNNYGAVITTYIFTLNDGKIITIKEDFGRREKEIFDSLFSYMWLPKSMQDVFVKQKDK